MKQPIRGVLGGALLAAFGILALGGQAYASYPDKPVKIVLPFPPGGSADTLIRLLSERLAERTGGTFLVENRPGASANLGTSYVAKAEPDGYTLLAGVTGAMSINPWLYPELDYVPTRDFQAISMLATAPVAVVASPASGIRSIPALIDKAKASADGLAYATNGVGTSHQLSAELFSGMAGVALRNVPYKGTPAALQDIAGNRVELGFLDLTASLPLIAGAKVIPVATTGSRRPAALPDVPTVQEAGYPEYESLTWIALVGPEGMPAEVVAKLNTEVKAILAEPAVQDKARGFGMEVESSTAAEAQAFIAAENTKWKGVIEKAGITLK